MPGHWKMYSTVCMTGCVFLGQVNSRPGPWAHLTLDTMEEMRAKKKEYWTGIEGQKQLAIRGAHGAYMCPAVVEASRIYESMLGRVGNEYWFCKTWAGDEQLKRACKVYLKGYPLLVPTSMRDFWETKLHHDDGAIANRITM